MSKQKQWCIKIIIYAYFCLFSASKVIMPYGKLITRFTTGGHDIFITCPAKSMHLEPFGLSVHAFCGTGDENIIPTCRSAGNYNLHTNMTITNRIKITLTPLRLHSASSVRIPNSINNFRTLIPAVRSRPLNLLSVSSVNLYGLANTSIFHNNLRVMLSPLKSPVLRKYSNPFKKPGMYPSISKCNAREVSLLYAFMNQFYRHFICEC